MKELIDLKQLAELLQKIPRVKAAVYGDFCLDVYWTLSPEGSEVSVETGIPAQLVDATQYSPGGAGNIVKNMMALGPAEVACMGIIGPELFGMELCQQLADLGARTEGLYIQPETFSTYTYIKRYLQKRELERIDFGIRNKRTQQSDNAVLTSLQNALSGSDVVVLNQQVPGSINRKEFIAELNNLLAESDTLVLLDSRHYSEQFDQVYFKINGYELATLFGRHIRHLADQDLEDLAMQLFERTQRPVFVTQGPKGIWVVTERGIETVPGIELAGEIDAVGAGDTVVSTLALSLAAGAEPLFAAQVANLAAAVTVKKLFQTGTASAEEIRKLARGSNT